MATCTVSYDSPYNAPSELKAASVELDINEANQGWHVTHTSDEHDLVYRTATAGVTGAQLETAVAPHFPGYHFHSAD